MAENGGRVWVRDEPHQRHVPFLAFIIELSSRLKSDMVGKMCWNSGDPWWLFSTLGRRAWCVLFVFSKMAPLHPNHVPHTQIMQT